MLPDDLRCPSLFLDVGRCCVLFRDQPNLSRRKIALLVPCVTLIFAARTPFPGSMPAAGQFYELPTIQTSGMLSRVNE